MWYFCSFLPDLYYFLLSPTLHYHLNFPRNSHCRHSDIIKRFLEVVRKWPCTYTRQLPRLPSGSNTSCIELWALYQGWHCSLGCWQYNCMSDVALSHRRISPDVWQKARSHFWYYKTIFLTLRAPGGANKCPTDCICALLKMQQSPESSALAFLVSKSSGDAITLWNNEHFGLHTVTFC